MSSRMLIVGVVYNVLLFGALLFIPALTVHWWRAWVFLILVLICSTASTIALNRANPAVIAERFKPPLQPGQPKIDKLIVTLLLTAYGVSVVAIPVDIFWLQALPLVPRPVPIAGLLLFLMGWLIVTLALKENAFASPAVRHLEEKQQTVVSTGVYGVVRHPLYAGAALILIGLPIWLRSYAGALVALIPIALFVIRIGVEERFLRRELAGYNDYTRRVRARLIPFIW